MSSQRPSKETVEQQQLSRTQDRLRDIVTLVREGKFGQQLDDKLEQADQILPKKSPHSRTRP